MKFKVKCFKVDHFQTKDQKDLYKVWFNLTSGFGWLLSNKPFTAGAEVELELISINSQDVKQNMRLGLRIV